MNLPILQDRDVGFTGMISRVDPALLPKGSVAKAVNRRFERGIIKNRWGVVRPVWGGEWTRITRILTVVASSNNHQATGGDTNAVPDYTQIACDPTVPEVVFPNGTRIYGDDGSNVVSTVEAIIGGSGKVASFHGRTASLGEHCGIITYRDANSGVELLLVAINEARTSDGGQGRVFVLRPGQSHLSILSDEAEELDMNGHDFYGPVRFIQTANSVVMLRPGPTRYYFKGNEVEGTNDYVTLHVTPDFITGTKVTVGVVNTLGLGSLIENTHYFARVNGAQVSFYATEAQAVAGGATGLVNLVATTSSQRYYVEVAESVNWWSRPLSSTAEVSTSSRTIQNDAPPLIMQASETLPDPLDNGFDRLPSALTIAAVNETDDLLTVPNHHLVPGDRITIDGTDYYVYPTDSQTIKLYNGDTGEDASLTGASGHLAVTTADFDGDTILKAGASGASIPAGREGIYFGNRLILVYGFDNIAVSDILDPLHYLPLLSEFKLNTGTNDPIVALYPFNQTTIIVFKERSILAIENVYGDLSNVRLVEITREFGCLAPRSIVSTGADIVFLSTRGVVSLKQTEFGLQQSVVLPLSDAIQDVIERLDQSNSHLACAAYFDNRYIISIPVETGDGTNELTLVYNFLNQAWDGLWEGSLLTPVQFERLVVGGKERLIWADSSGYIHYFDPLALQDRTYKYDGTEEIETEVRFRAYHCDYAEHKQWTEAQFTIATHAPSMTATVQFDGLSETLTLTEDWTRSRTAYTRYNTTAYDTTNEDDDFLDAHRQDYSVYPDLYIGSGIKVNQHQHYTYKAQLRGLGAFMQPIITTNAGSVEVRSTYVAAVPHRLAGKLDS